MDAKHALHRLLHLALIEIRFLAQTNGDIKNIAALSDLLHNLPLALSQENPDYNKILEEMVERASHNKNLKAWVINNSSSHLQS